MQILHTMAGRGGGRKQKTWGVAYLTGKVVGNVPSVARKTDECLVVVMATKAR